MPRVRPLAALRSPANTSRIRCVARLASGHSRGTPHLEFMPRECPNSPVWRRRSPPVPRRGLPARRSARPNGAPRFLPDERLRAFACARSQGLAQASL
ncbi:hypothetical protein X949_5328 [Burkholderia pseudomallei MSHR5609]|nr:hypothetical protein X949_5328 [Burkholderia pseudomallei MSHR5609]